MIGSLAFVMQAVEKKENSECKLVLLHLQNDFVPHSTHGRGVE